MMQERLTATLGLDTGREFFADVPRRGHGQQTWIVKRDVESNSIRHRKNWRRILEPGSASEARAA